MSKPGKSKILPAILLCYTLVMGVIIFPYYKSTGRWFEYVCIIGVAIFLSLLLAYLFKRREKDKSQ